MNTDIPNSDEIEVILSDIVNKITGTFKPQKIILFGSFANGNPREDSDIDLLVIMESRKRQIERIRDISRLLRPRPAPMDILVKTPREIEERIAINDLFIKDIVNRGRVLYERTSP